MKRNKKKIVIIVGSYFPYPSAVGVCASNIAKELSNEFDVSIVCVKTSNNQPDFEVIDGCNIYRVSYSHHALMNSKNAFGVFFKVRKLFSRLSNSASKLLSPFDFNIHLVDAFFSKIEIIKEIDVLIPFSFPVESLEASVRIKKLNPKVLLVPYVYDNYVESEPLHKFKLNALIKRKNYIKAEERFIESSDMYVAVHSLRTHYETTLRPDLLRKVVFTEHPLLRRNDGYKSVSNDLMITYTGSLIKGYVEAEGFLELLSEIDSKHKFHFYAFGNGVVGVNKFLNENVFLHDKVSKDEVNEIIRNSSVLISIAEFSGKQISSKIFDYMSSGKPIIQYSYSPDCINVKILEKYPLKLNIFHDDGAEVNSKKLVNFLDSVSGKSVSFEQVAKLYPDALPSYNANLISRYVNESFD